MVEPVLPYGGSQVEKPTRSGAPEGQSEPARNEVLVSAAGGASAAPPVVKAMATNVAGEPPLP